MMPLPPPAASSECAAALPLQRRISLGRARPATGETRRCLVRLLSTTNQHIVAMNTANLQLQGVLAVLTSLLQAMERKGALSRAEIGTALNRAEADAVAGAQRHEGLSDAHIDAVRFPARYLRMALTGDPGLHAFAKVASAVGRAKDSAAD
jgi:hypothetical protein